MTDTKQIAEIESPGPSRNRKLADLLRQNRARLGVAGLILFLILSAMAGIEADQWFATVMKGLATGALVFLVASGFQLIFGLMDVLNLAHGEIFMLGAYVGWTVYTRFDTFLDVLIPVLVLAAPFALMPLWRQQAERITALGRRGRALAWGLMVGGAALVVLAITKFPLVIWNPDNFAQTPVNMSVQVSAERLAPLSAEGFGWPLILAFVVLFLGAAILALGIVALRKPASHVTPLGRTHFGILGGLLAGAVVLQILKGPLNTLFFGELDPATGMWVGHLSTTGRFFVAIVVSTLVGAALGALVEVLLIRPLYDRPIYTLMITLGVGFVMIEMAREIWGRSEFTMARPAAFNGTGDGCPGEGIGGVFSGCSTMIVFGSRLVIYNDVFLVVMGLAVLIGVSALLKYTRIGMTIRAGVENPEMVEALGINVRRVFTQVFALGSGLAALGGVLAAPSIGLSTEMGALFLLTAIVALAIGGLTSFPGAAAGALLIGLLQQIIIRLGQTGINLPFVAEPFKPSPTLVPAASIILMVVILLVLPAGLFGRGER